MYNSPLVKIKGHWDIFLLQKCHSTVWSEFTWNQNWVGDTFLHMVNQMQEVWPF